MDYKQLVETLTLLKGTRSWRKLSAHSGVDYGVIYKIANGRTRNPTASTIVALVESIKTLRLDDEAKRIKDARRRIPALLRRT